MLRVVRTAAFVLCCLAASVGCGTSAAGLLRSALVGSFTVSGGGSSSQNQLTQPVGACCISTGDCLTVTASDCANFFGTFFGEGITCGIAPCTSGF